MHNLTQLDTKTWILKIKYWKFIIKRLSDAPYRNTVSFSYKMSYIIWEYKYLCFHEINLEFSDSLSFVQVECNIFVLKTQNLKFKTTIANIMCLL